MTTQAAHKRTDWTLSNAQWGLGDRENLSDALRILDALVNTCEMNADELEPYTITVLDAATRFLGTALQNGYKTSWKESLHGDE